MISVERLTSHLTFSRSIWAGICLRLILLVYGEFHDQHSDLKYTDVDYRVFSDAAGFVLHPSSIGGANYAQGPLAARLGWELGDPYTRATYRYTPLLALVLAPNEFIHPCWGKFLFATADILVGIILYKILLSSTTCDTAQAATSQDKAKEGDKDSSSEITPRAASSTALSSSPHVSRNREQTAALWVSCFWLLNPMVANISTRGSAESVLGLLVVSSLALTLKGRLDAAAIMLGVAVHFKIYPFIYASSIVTSLARWESTSRLWWLSWKQVRFGIISLLAFLLLSIGMYGLWGAPFLEHSYLYHLARRDHRHNFSLYFYPTYLTYPERAASTHHTQLSAGILASPLVSFLPQMTLSLGSGLVFGRQAEHLPFSFLVQTMAFVTFNKVCTSQYFMWYIWFLPLVLPRVKMPTGKAITTTAVWIGTQALWLSLAYRLEFLGEQVFLSLWIASTIFLLGNSYVLAMIVQNYS